MKFTIEMNVHELSRSIQAGTLNALVKDMQANEDRIRATTSEIKPTIEKGAVDKKETESPEIKAPVAEGSPITIEQIRAAFIAKNSKENTQKLKTILNDHGVKKVTDLKKDDFPSVIKALEEL